MRTVRELTEELAFSLADRLTAIVERDGNDATLLGYPIIADESCFTKGAVIGICTQLYLRAVRAGAPDAGKYRERMLHAFSLVGDDETVRTWGKLSILKSVLALKKEGELSLLSEEQLALLNRKTVYDDFADLESLRLIGLAASNYFHVAMECAGLRELLGFESKGASERFKEKMISVMKEGSESGWMDESPPNGRFDSYSVGMNLTMCNALELVEKPVPDFMRENAIKSAELFFAARNRKGHGFSYGRSISMYGESAAVGHMLYAIRAGVFTGARREEAIAYCIHAAEKLVDFWYDKELGLCNIWLKGRATENYRGIHRIFEVNMEFVKILWEVLDGFEQIGWADKLPETDVSLPDTWQWHKELFVDGEEHKRAAYVLRYENHAFMLPLIGISTYMGCGSYMPFPHEPWFLESPPSKVEWEHPFLTPAVVLKDGTVAFPVQYYTAIRERETAKGLQITAEGHLAVSHRNYKNPCHMIKETFSVAYVFEDSRIRVEYDIPDGVYATVLFAGESTAHLDFCNAVSVNPFDASGNEQYHTPSGALKEGVHAAYRGGHVVYEISL